MKRFVDPASDLIAFPAIAFAFGIFLIAGALFLVAGPLAGFAISVPLWGFVLWFGFRDTDPPFSQSGRSGDRRGNSLHRILVVADRGLGNPALAHEASLRATAHRAEVLLIVPVEARSRVHGVTDDVDGELSESLERQQSFTIALRGMGLIVRGHVDVEADPESALRDGIREFSPNEVMLVPGDERGWSKAEALGSRIREQIGIPVTEIGPTVALRPRARSTTSVRSTRQSGAKPAP